ncbi:MAG: hypothetical protein IIV14_01465 [Bacteroidaceae bacterium]|nr:hypothetical protein [Bacteroidaceae bacterium]
MCQIKRWRTTSLLHEIRSDAENRLSLPPEVFGKLKKEDKYLLGHLYGVYGYEK